VAVCPVLGLNAVSKVREKFVAAFEYAEADEWLTSEIVEDLSSDRLGSVQNKPVGNENVFQVVAVVERYGE